MRVRDKHRPLSTIEGTGFVIGLQESISPNSHTGVERSQAYVGLNVWRAGLYARTQKGALK